MTAPSIINNAVWIAAADEEEASFVARTGTAKLHPQPPLLPNPPPATTHHHCSSPENQHLPAGTRPRAPWSRSWATNGSWLKGPED